MTTIACDGRELAADGRVSGNGLTHMTDCAKVHRLKNGSVVGFSGSVYFHGAALDFLNGKRTDIDLGNEFEAIILHHDGTAECMDGLGRRYVQSTPCVTGSGSGIALGAMAAGASPKNAVEIAARYDQATGGTILSLKPKRKK